MTSLMTRFFVSLVIGGSVLQGSNPYLGMAAFLFAFYVIPRQRLQ